MAREWTDTNGESLEVGDIPAQNGASAWTIAGWFWHDDQGGADNEFIYAGDSAGALDFMQFFWQQSGSQYRTRWDIGGAARLVDIPQAEVSTGAMHHYAARYDGSTFEVILDKVSKGTVSISSTLDDTGGFAFGNSHTNQGATGPWDGRLAEWGMWDRSLADNELDALANGVSPARYAPNQLYLPMLGTATEPDWSGRSASVTINGTPDVADHVPLGPPWVGNNDAVKLNPDIESSSSISTSSSSVSTSSSSISTSSSSISTSSSSSSISTSSVIPEFIALVDEGHLTGGMIPLGGGLL